MGSPCGLLSPLGTGWAYHVPYTRQNGLGSASPPVALSSAIGEITAPIPGHSAFWLEPFSIFGSSFLTTFISSLHGLAIPSDPSSRTALMLAVVISPHGLMTVLKDEATLSPELHTAGLLQPHVWVEYWWQHTRLCPIQLVITAVYTTSCHTRLKNSRPCIIGVSEGARAKSTSMQHHSRTF